MSYLVFTVCIEIVQMSYSICTSSSQGLQKMKICHLKKYTWDRVRKAFYCNNSKNLGIASNFTHEVTTDNFREELEKFETYLKNVLFVSMDLEFTGLYYDGREDTSLDAIEYQKMAKMIPEYIPLQLGLTLFKKSEESFESMTFSVYLWSSEANYVCVSPSSLSFLRKHEFDLNYLVDKGVSYLNEQEFQVHSDSLRKYFGGSVPSDTGTIFVWDDYIQRIETIADNLEVGESRFLTKLPKQDAFLLNQCINDKYPNLVLRFNPFISEPALFLWKVDDKKRWRDQEYEYQRKKLFNLKGGSHFLDSIVKKNIPIIGHNCFYDLLYIHHHLYSKLPDTYSKFWASMKRLPPIFDTKYIFESKLVNSIDSKSNLEALYTNLPIQSSNNSILRIPNDSSASKSSNKPHEAGHDSYMTGEVFIRMAEMLNLDYTNLQENPLRNKIRRQKNDMEATHWVNEL